MGFTAAQRDLSDAPPTERGGLSFVAAVQAAFLDSASLVTYK